MPATIVQVPADFALTLPLLTEAIELLVLDQVMLLSVALPGYALALRLALSPTVSDILLREMLTLVTDTVLSLYS